ncbi:putative Isoflavone reductase [Cocos nucifera]|uniref:Putative Isoflavone reductase n=1 Tax=Cocos nucifera TaxID=13894 RepID=A0A8K0ISG5_COCNU|nr:putative Isoflavone reductase [Cocos nucifera]
MAGEKSKILIIGSTGYIGKFITAASVRCGHRTFALVRDTAPSDPAKAKLLDDFKSSGVTLIQGDLYDHGSLVKAIKQVDVVISTVGFLQLADQTKIIAAIKEAGNIKRFFPSEFGIDFDRGHAVEPAKSIFATKAQIRRAIEAEGIPYTIVCSNFFAGYFLPSLGQVGAAGLPTDKVVILGDGNAQVIIVDEDDIGTFTIRAVDDPRTVNKILYLKPPANTFSHNELVSLWEKKVGKTFERVYVPEEELLKQIQESSIPFNVVLSICHYVLIKADHANFRIDPSFGVEATDLYPDVKYTTRFFPSEFGIDFDRGHAVEPAKSIFATKAQIRRAIEAEGIPYTIVCSNFFAGYFLPSLGQVGAAGLPTDKVVILGDGNAQVIIVDEDDIGTFTIRAVDDPRTVNKILYLKPPANTFSHNELVSLWEKKVGKTFERVYVPEEELLKQIQESSIPFNVVLSICHYVLIKADHANFRIDPSFGVEATDLYPDVKYTTVDDYLNRFL